MKSAKLAALHARLSLPTKLPRQTLARCLIDPTVDARPDYNNIPLATLGRDLLSYYTSEWLICKYPRIPMAVLFAAQDGYVGPGTLNAMRMEWGVEAVAAPGPEVDPGLLQLKRKTPGNAMAPDGTRRLKDVEAEQAALQEKRGRRTISGKIVYDDEFGEPGELPTGGVKASSIKKGDEDAELAADEELEVDLDMDTTATATATTVEQASARFVRALVGALYLHAGKDAAKAFHHDHVLSRHLPLHNLFNFRFPTRDLSLLCKREGFEPPVARLISETGRLSRTPVFVVGIFSGEDKLGEGVGASLDEARVRAAAAALRSWYLYSPPASEIFLPSEFDGSAARTKQWKPQYIDPGEIVQ
jgi:dsRNA-specific ribonuclease